MWLVASTIFDHADEHLNLRGRREIINVVALPIPAAVVMTVFDVGSDSVAATCSNSWTWEQGGGVFGVPYTNYFGWWFVTYVFFQLFALMLARRQARQSAAMIVTAGATLAPVFIYVSLGFSSVSYFIANGSDTRSVLDQAGRSWGVAALAETMMTINIFGVVVIAFIALAKNARDAGLASRQAAPLRGSPSAQ